MFPGKDENKTEGGHKKHAAGSGEKIISSEEYHGLLAKSKELEELRDKMIRTAADYENAKKRAVREKEEFMKYANERLIQEFLPVLDSLDRALEHAKTHKDSRESILEGIEIIRKHLYDVLKSNGLERQNVIGKKFDPHQHEAIGDVEKKDVPEETIVDELQGGYTYQGRLLRPAKVRISKGGKPVPARKINDEKDADIT